MHPTMLTILIVDEQFAVLEVLLMALAGQGHRVLKAVMGADALRILAQTPCDLVICSGGLRVAGGVQLVDAIRAHASIAHTPVIMLVDALAPPTSHAPGIHVLAKPVVLRQLFGLIDSIAAANRHSS